MQLIILKTISNETVVEINLCFFIVLKSLFFNLLYFISILSSLVLYLMSNNSSFVYIIFIPPFNNMYIQVNEKKELNNKNYLALFIFLILSSPNNHCIGFFATTYTSI